MLADAPRHSWRMALTNAERQKRHRERLRAAASAASGLTAEQRADRDAIMSEPLYPVPPSHARQQMPCFMGWERYDWSAAPEPLIDHFGKRAAWEGWRSEMDVMRIDQDSISARGKGLAERIIAECGDRAIEILARGGRSALLAAYDADPTLA